MTERENVIVLYRLELDDAGLLDSLLVSLASHFFPGTTAQLGDRKHATTGPFHARIKQVDEIQPHEISSTGKPDRKFFLIQVEIPTQTLEANLPMLLSAIAGEIQAFGRIRVDDVDLPKTMIDDFSGPKFGIEGIRELLAIPSRPILVAIQKPNLGFSPEEGAKSFLAAALGGADIVKDDEVLSNPSYCQRVDRVRRYLKREKEAYEETGEHTLYAVNITDRVDQVHRNALEAVELGANALMVNFFHTGLDATRVLCEDPRIGVPILGHNAGAAALFANPDTGMSADLANALFPRLIGLDMCIVLSHQGKFAVEPEQCAAIVRRLREPFFDIRSTLPILGGGMTPALTPLVTETFGQDLALGAGGTLFGHPGGARSGARAFRQSIQCTLEGRDLLEASREYTELRQAMEVSI